MDNLEPFLPFLRPRSAEPTWYMLLVLALLCVGLVLLLGLYLIRWRRRQRQLAEHFMRLAANLGLDSHQGHFLLHIARQKHLSDPLLLLTSVNTFERHLGRLAAALVDRNPADPTLDTIARIRTLLGFDLLPPDHALRSTRQLPTGQTLMVWTRTDEREDFSPWMVVSRDERALVVAPFLREEHPQFDAIQPGVSLTAHFWRPGDTEYRFTTQVLRLDPAAHTATLRHVDRLERLQHRDFFRLPVNFPLRLFALPDEEEDRPEPREQLAEEQEQDEPSAQTDGTSFSVYGLAEEPALSFDLDQATPVDGQVTNLSGGGMYLVIPGPVPSTSRLLVDPAFVGPFPLQGLCCDLVQQTETSGGFGLQLQFASLSPARERELIRLLFQEQIQAQHDPGEPTQAPDPASTEDSSS